MTMSIQELLVQAMNVANRLSGITSVEVSKYGSSNSIDITFKNSVGDSYNVNYDVTLEGHTYNKTISLISNLSRRERFSELDYSQDDLKMILERVNK